MIIAAHLIYATDRDLDAILETDAGYAHCATIYPRLAIFPRLETILRRKVKTGFGTDWMQNDPFEGMRNAMNVIRVKLDDAEFLPCSEALWCHTMGSAQVLGLDKEIGSLEAGKKADLSPSISTMRICSPTMGITRRSCITPRAATWS